MQWPSDVIHALAKCSCGNMSFVAFWPNTCRCEVFTFRFCVLAVLFLHLFDGFQDRLVRSVRSSMSNAKAPILANVSIRVSRQSSPASVCVRVCRLQVAKLSDIV